MSKKKVAIQGAPGSFHELAAKKYFKEDIQCIECRTFKDVFNLVVSNNADFGVTAIENTVAGTILPNYAMLRESETQIIGEVYLHIQQNLLALPGQTIDDIQEVYSHPMAILQSQTYFEQYPHIRLVEAGDTASQARWISENKLKNIGAIAGSHVASLYGLQLLAEGIETHKKNFTRFLVLTQPDSPAVNKKMTNKTSAYFNINHEKGSLANVLVLLANHSINLTSIQSLPVIGKEWEYYIHVDMEFELVEQYKKALTTIAPLLNEFKILGEYQKGDKSFVKKS